MSLTKIRKSNIEPNVQLPHANAAFDTANSASSYANSAYIHANAAFDLANTGGGVNITHDNFKSDGSNTSFSLSATPENENYTLVTINGVVQHKESYSLSGSTIILSEAPLVNSSIDILTFTSSSTITSYGVDTKSISSRAVSMSLLFN